MVTWTRLGPKGLRALGVDLKPIGHELQTLLWHRSRLRSESLVEAAYVQVLCSGASDSTVPRFGCPDRTWFGCDFVLWTLFVNNKTPREKSTGLCWRVWSRAKLWQLARQRLFLIETCVATAGWLREGPNLHYSWFGPRSEQGSGFPMSITANGVLGTINRRAPALAHSLAHLHQ